MQSAEQPAVRWSYYSDTQNVSYEEWKTYQAILRELENILRATVHDDVWTYDHNGNIITVKERIKQLREELEEKQSGESAERPAVEPGTGKHRAWSWKVD